MMWRAEILAVVGGFEVDVALRGGAEPIALIGPNGSGKTTLLRTVAGAIEPVRGRIEVDAVVMFDHETGVALRPDERGVGYVPQGYGLFPHLSVLDNVAFGAPGAGRRARREAARTVLDDLGISELATRSPGRLSGGERQRTALGRALARRPRMLLLDEPLSALDAVSRRSVRRFLAEQLRALGIPSVVATHDVRDVAALNATVFVLDEGHIVQTGRLDELRRSPVNDFVAEFTSV